MGQIKITFPCGFIIESKTIHWYWGDIEFINLYKQGCPLHGKDCLKRVHESQQGGK